MRKVGSKDADLAVGIVGAGMIGQSWAIAFARGGYQVRLYDSSSSVVEQAVEEIERKLPDLHHAGLLDGVDPAVVMNRISVAKDLEQMAAGVVHIQENAPEIRELKRTIFATLDALAPPDATIASSSSALLPSEFLGSVARPQRCMVNHPLNPPHLVPAVELVPGPQTDLTCLRRVAALMRDIGQQPVVLSREIAGFVMNRLQGAILEEAFRLLDDGIVSPEDLDRAVKHGLGLRWSFMGPIETIDLNAPGGVGDFVERYDAAYRAIDASRGARVPWKGALSQLLEKTRQRLLPRDCIPGRQAWRDRQLMALAAHKRSTREQIES